MILAIQSILPGLLNISFEFEYYPLLIVVFLAFVIPIVLNLLKMGKVPSVVVEILVGYVVGKFIISSFPDAHIQPLDFLALSGFMFLMFLAGLEIDINEIIQSFPKRRITVSRFIKIHF
ncbi:MAG: cation:proton antiporter [Bacteroidota bacterium]